MSLEEYKSGSQLYALASVVRETKLSVHAEPYHHEPRIPYLTLTLEVHLPHVDAP